MQETVGETLTEEQKRQYLMQCATAYGYKDGPKPEHGVEDLQTPGPPEAKENGVASSTTTTATSSTSSSSVLKDVKNKFDKKNARGLQRRVSDEEPARRDLSQAMESAAEEQEDIELMPDVPPAPPAAAPAPPPAASADDLFWMKMSSVLDVKIQGLGQEFTTALHAVETRLGTEIQKEREERSAEGKNTNSRIDEIADRLFKLETKEPELSTSVPVTTPSQQGVWVSRHLVFGGWKDSAPREQIESDSRKWVEKLPEATRGQLLMPYAPKKFGEIAKCKVAEGASTDAHGRSARPWKSSPRRSCRAAWPSSGAPTRADDEENVPRSWRS